MVDLRFSGSGSVCDLRVARQWPDFTAGLQMLALDALRPDIKSQFPINAASSTGRCNTFQSVDPAILPPRKPIYPAVLNQTLARAVSRLNQRSRTTLSS